METAAAQRTDCCWLLLLLLLQCPGLEWVGANHRKSGQNKKTRRDPYPGPRWRGPSCQDGLLPSRTFPLLALPPLSVPPLALPSRSTIHADPLLSRASGVRFMPPNLAQNDPSVAHKVPPGPPRRHVYSCPRESEGGYRPIPPALKGGYRPLVRLLLQLQRLFTVQSGPVLLELYSATKRTHFLYLYSSNLSPGYLVIPPLFPCFSLDYLGWQLLDQPFLFNVFFLFPPKSPPFPTWRLQLMCIFLQLFASLPPSPISPSFPFPFPFPSSFPFPCQILLSFPSPLPSPFPPYVRPRASTSVPVPVPAPSPLPSSFPFTLLRSPPPPFPFPPTTPFPYLFPPPTLIPPLPPTPLAPSRPSDSVTPSVRCACTGTRPCKRSFWVPVSATPCLQRWYHVQNKSG